MTNLEHWRNYLRDLESPLPLIDWPLYFAVAASLERRVWFGSSKGFEIFPNIYVIVVGGPSVGKSLPMSRAVSMLEKLQAVKGGTLQSALTIAPDSVTLERLTQILASCGDSKILKNPDGTIKRIPHSSISIASEDLAVLFRKNTEDLVRFFVQGYDARNYRRETKNQGKDLITNICISFYGCTQPEFISSQDASLIIGQGFGSRVIFLWGEDKRFRKAKIEIDKEQEQDYEAVKAHLQKLTELCGEVKFSSEAEEFFVYWYEKDFDRTVVNSNKKLEAYYGRKKLHVRKLAMILHFLDNFEFEVQKSSVEKALKLLCSAEIEMHKALCATSKNVLATISEKILECLAKNGREMSIKRIRLAMFDQADVEQQDKCLEFLKQTGQIKIIESKILLLGEQHNESGTS